jgi:uncharacterized protein YcaQ
VAEAQRRNPRHAGRPLASEGAAVITLEDLRRFAVARSLFPPTSLQRALDRLAFVQADPIRAPARAQDLTLRHRVKGYRGGDLERKYTTLDVEEDVFVNYGFVTRRLHDLMHPRATATSFSRSQKKRVEPILAFIRARGAVHPRDVEREFAHGTVTNYWGGSSNATTHLLDLMHYRGLLRIVRRDTGIRVYGVREVVPPPDKAERARRLDALVDVAVGKYAPLPSASLSFLIARLRYAVPQWRRDVAPALARARKRLAHATVDGIEWYWPAAETVTTSAVTDTVRLLAPFDPVVWDRRRFELLWGWAYRFEAYTPVTQRKLGYYALPLLWRQQVIGWGNLSVVNGALGADIGYVSGRRPRDRGFVTALEMELDRLREFLALPANTLLQRESR